MRFQAYRYPKWLSISLGLCFLATSTSCVQGQGSVNTTGTMPDLPDSVPRIVNTVQQNSGSTANNNISSEQVKVRFDWSTDRVKTSNKSFKTQAFTDSIKATLDVPSVATSLRQGTNNAGFVNEFAKVSSSEDNSLVIPNVPAVSGTTTIMLTSSSSASNVFALNNLGDLIWQNSLHDNGGKFLGSSPSLGKQFTNSFYAISDQGRLYAINISTGIVQGFIDTSDTFAHASPLVIQDTPNNVDRVFVGSQSGKVYQYRFNGSAFLESTAGGVDWTVHPSAGTTGLGKISSSILTSPNSNYLYVGSEDGKFYRLDRSTGTAAQRETTLTSTNVTFTTQSRSTLCRVKATPVLDIPLDVGVVSCGGYLYRVKLNDLTASGMSITAQSPLLELSGLKLFKEIKRQGPNHDVRPKVHTFTKGDPEPKIKDFEVEVPFGFKTGDFVHVRSKRDEDLYGELDKVDKQKFTFKEELFPLPSPSPSPFFTGGEKVTLANDTVRPSPVPVLVTPTVAVPVGDTVSSFTAGNIDELSTGDWLHFPSLPGAPLVRICTATDTNCDNNGGGAAYAGIDTGTKVVTVGHATLATLMNTEITNGNMIPFVKMRNQVVGPTVTTTQFNLADASGIKTNDVVRIVHQNGNDRGLYEYAIVQSVNSGLVTLTSNLRDLPAMGDRLEVVNNDTGVYGRVFPSLNTFSSDIVSSPVLGGGGSQFVYLAHGNVLYELDYTSVDNFKSSATYSVLQAGRLDQENVSLTDASRSTPFTYLGANGLRKLVVLDSDPIGKTGIYANRYYLPLSNTMEKLNDVFPINAPNGPGHMPRRAETRPILFDTSFVTFGGGNGIVYKLHKDKVW